MSTKIVRLTSGEEIICFYSEEDGISELKKPAIIIPTGQGQLSIMPWLAYADLADKSIKIDKRFIVFVVDCQTDMLNEYNSAFGSGLFIPTSPGPALAGGGPMGAADTSIGGKKPSLKLSK
jgi:hypothetical protein